MRLTLREAAVAFKRTPTLSFLSITTIGFALFVVGLFGLVALNLRDALETMEQRVEIVMYVMRDTPIEAVTIAMDDIESFPEVKEARYVSEEEALKRARSELVELKGVYEDLTSNPLPASIEISLKPGSRDSRTVQRVANRLRGFDFAEDVRFGRDWVRKLDNLRDVAALVMLVIGGAFAVASIIIIGTTIRMTVLQRATEIAIMRLVGATDGFIRRPFLLEGLIKGTLGGVLAVLLNYGTFVAVNRALFRTQFYTPAEAAVVVGLGGFLGFVASAVSVRKHLRRI